MARKIRAEAHVARIENSVRLVSDAPTSSQGMDSDNPRMISMAVGAVSEFRRPSIRIGQEVNVRFVSGDPSNGTIQHISLSAEATTRTYKVVHEYKNDNPMVGKPNIWARTQRSIRKVQKENPDVKFDAVISTDGMLYQFVSFE